MLNLAVLHLEHQVYCVFFAFLGRPAFLLASRSPSASHLLALTICTMLMYCLAAMTGADAIMRIHGTVELILFARAISMAAAEKGLAKNMEGLGTAGEPGWMEVGVLRSEKRVGESSGEENDKR
jgi:hypothetical protein